jgi:hypothetical protein
VLGGVIAISMGNADWRWKVALIFIPVVLYGILMIGRKFPVNERVAAGVSYMEMLREVGALGALIVTYMIGGEIVRVLGSLGLPVPQVIFLMVVAVIAVWFGLFTKSLGQPLFIFLVLVMIPLATTELGTDSWISDLMKPEAQKFGLNNAGWLLVYTSVIMMVLRFFAGPIVHKLSPLGLLAASAAIAAVGLFSLSQSVGVVVILAATLYGLGKTFFWPTMLGVVAEQFPKGGALTLNSIAGVGMLAVGVVGSPLFGKLQDDSLRTAMNQELPGVYERVAGEKLTSFFGEYRPIDDNKRDQLTQAEKDKIGQIENRVRKETLRTVAIFPVIMFVSYIGLIVYFQSRGGYKPKVLITEKEEEALMAGGAPAANEF